MTGWRHTGIVVLVMVGVPVGVAVVAHETAHDSRVSQRGVVERQLRTKLQREGAKHIQCSWTKGPPATVSCTGESGSSSGVDGVVIQRADSR